MTDGVGAARNRGVAPRIGRAISRMRCLRSRSRALWRRKPTQSRFTAGRTPRPALAPTSSLGSGAARRRGASRGRAIAAACTGAALAYTGAARMAGCAGRQNVRRQRQRQPKRQPQCQSGGIRLSGRIRLSRRGGLAVLAGTAGRRSHRGRRGDRLRLGGERGGLGGRAAASGPTLVLPRLKPTPGLLGRLPVGSNWSRCRPRAEDGRNRFVHHQLAGHQACGNARPALLFGFAFRDRAHLASPVKATTFTDGYEWTEFDLSPGGAEAWGSSHDPDARPETRVKFVKLEVAC